MMELVSWATADFPVAVVPLVTKGVSKDEWNDSP
jgi:hypothetical protein